MKRKKLVAKSSVKLTDLEEEFLALLPRSGKPLTTHELVEKYWPGEQPYNARGIVIARMNGIMRKLAYMGGNVQVAKSARRGPQPISFFRKS